MSRERRRKAALKKRIVITDPVTRPGARPLPRAVFESGMANRDTMRAAGWGVVKEQP